MPRSFIRRSWLVSIAFAQLVVADLQVSHLGAQCRVVDSLAIWALRQFSSALGAVV